ncbi:P-loop containing nucleoside triphosphate hydrolase protein [Xylaria digitata]|nr:P-loop containing nucleoside triphosphate hydrolase protein [Xylaria digitata]
MASNSSTGFEPRPTDIIVAVMGMTGSGKSTFISLCTDQHVQIGHGLQACTQKVDVYKCLYEPNIDVYMIDTPGFDDTNRSDTDVLKDIATWLTKSYANSIQLNGMLYFHRITDTRMGKSAKKNLYLFKKLCGSNALQNVLLVSTMWENVDLTIGNNHEQELIQTEEFWGAMLKQGAQLARHKNNRESAMQLLTHFVDKQRTTMAIQSEMVNDKKMLHETTAGQELDSELIAQREHFQKELDETKQMFREAKEQQDLESANQLREHEEKMAEKIERIRQEREELRINMQKMHESSAEMVKRLEKKLEDQKRIHLLNMEKMKQLERKIEGQQRIHEKEDEKPRAEPENQEEAHQEATTSPASISSRNMIHHYNVNISLAGTKYAFVGPARNMFNIPELSPHESTDETLSSETYIAVGTNGSWYCHRLKGNNRNSWSDNLPTEYPRLYEWLENRTRPIQPTQFTLGPNGTFFVVFGLERFYYLPKAIKQEVDITNVRKLWLGFGGAYVIERLGGGKRWDLKGHYRGLSEDLEQGIHGCKNIKDLAMNIENPASYAVIMADSSSKYTPGAMLPDSAWKLYMTKNFGTKWEEGSVTSRFAKGFFRNIFGINWRRRASI